VAEKCLNDISYDVTEICTIVDISDSKNGHYIVTDGTIKYDAYCESTNYKVDDIVRVSIMNGDYT
jgi:hypothetical protein